MHEVALVAELVDAAAARTGDRRAAEVHVRYASTIPEDVLRQAWAMLVVGSPLENARLVAEPFDVELSCSCGFDGRLGHDDVIGPGQAVCPECMELREIPVTPELVLVEVVVAAGREAAPV